MRVRPVRLASVRRWVAWLTPVRAVLVLAAGIRVFLAIWDQGLVWPDELFQTLEQAHRFAFGTGLVPWEFRDGARSWLYPGVLGLLLKAASAVGVSHALTLVQIAKLAMAALGVWGVWLGTELARALSGKRETQERAALLAAVFGALCPVVVIFSTRCMVECASAPFVLAAALEIERTPRRRRAALAGACAALAVLFRYQNGLLALGFLVVLLARRRWKDALAYGGGGAVVAALGGILDWVTWGVPFRPLYVYVKFSLEGGPSDWGVSPWSFFLDHFSATVGASTVVLGIGFLVAALSSPGLTLVVFAFVAAHAAIPHKELRFLLPVVPLAVVLSAVGLARLLAKVSRRALPTYLLAAALGLLMAWRLRAPTLGDLGYDYQDEHDVVWHVNEDYFRAGLDASRDEDLCGLAYLDNAQAWSGGYTYLHRDVPVLFDSDPLSLAAVNYAVGDAGAKLPKGWRRVRVHGGYALFHRDGGCGRVPKGWSLDIPR